MNSSTPLLHSSSRLVISNLVLISLVLTNWLFISISFSQVPIGAVLDTELLAANTTNNVVQGTTLFLLNREKPLQETIKNVQEFFLKANTIVNGAVKNMQMVRQVVNLQADIIELYDRSLTAINKNRAASNDIAFIDKWKHAQILLALTKEATSVFELFEQLLAEDAMIINDKGRIQLLERVYKDMRMIKAAMRLQLRRINKEIYQYKRLETELKTFNAFFKTSE